MKQGSERARCNRCKVKTPAPVSEETTTTSPPTTSFSLNSIKNRRKTSMLSCNNERRMYGQPSKSETPAEPQTTKYQCNWCVEDFESESEVALHKQLDHHGRVVRVMASAERPACPVCLKTFESALRRDRHVRTRHLYIASPRRRTIDRPIFVCDYCTNIFFNKKLLAFHLGTRHKYVSSLGRLASCPVCDRRMVAVSLHQHMELHTIKSVATCPICVMKLPDQKALRRHVGQAHRPRFKCHFCQLETAGYKELDEHLETKHGRTRSECQVPKPQVRRLFTHDSRQQIRYNVAWPTNGLCLANVLRVCLLCRKVCPTAKMRRHLELNHGHRLLEAPAPGEEAAGEAEEQAPAPPSAALQCCGRSFTSRLLLRHHTFQEHTPRAQDAELKREELIDFDECGDQVRQDVYVLYGEREEIC